VWGPYQDLIRVSIVIRTLNESRFLPRVLEALARQSVLAKDRETIVVDSGSTDDTVDIANRAGCKILHVTREEFSFGRSLNRGCSAAEGNVLAFVSAHCIPRDAQWLENLIAPIELGEVSIAYGRQIGGDDTKLSEHQVFAKYYPKQGSFEEIPFFCNNANAAVTAVLWKKLLFAENLTGLEDMEFAKRAHNALQSHVKYVPQAVVSHHHLEGWRQVKRRYEREAYALQHIMPELQFTAGDAIRCFLGGVANDIRAVPLRTAGLRIAKEVLLYRFCQYYGAWKGHHLHRELSKKRKQKYFYPS